MFLFKLLNNIYSMTHPVEQNQEKSLLYTSTLISLFEDKGYNCEAIKRDQETIYVMKFDRPKRSEPFEPRERISSN